MQDCKKCKTKSCGCKIKLPADCVFWNSEPTPLFQAGESLKNILLEIESLLGTHAGVLLENIGSGVSVYAGSPNPNTHQFKTLLAGEGIELTTTEDTVTINSEVVVPAHNSLEGLQGGSTGEYYHLTQAQYNSLGIIPNLQEVTNVGNITTNSVISKNNTGTLKLNPSSLEVLNPTEDTGFRFNSGSWSFNSPTSSYTMLQNPYSFRIRHNTSISDFSIMDGNSFTLRSLPSGGERLYKIVKPTTTVAGTWEHSLQSKNGVLAHLSDITTPNLQQVTTVGNTTSNSIFQTQNNFFQTSSSNSNTRVEPARVISTFSSSGTSRVAGFSVNGLPSFHLIENAEEHVIRQTAIIPTPTTYHEHLLQKKSGTLAHLSDIPLQFNPIQGTNITITGTYPNFTFNASGGGGNVGTLQEVLTNGNLTNNRIRFYDVNELPTFHVGLDGDFTHAGIFFDDGSNQSGVYPISNQILIQSNNENFTGLTYNDNYSENFTNRSLVDKEYVDNKIPTIRGGVQTITSDGVTETYTFPHGATIAPTTVIVTRGNSLDFTVFSTSWDTTNVTIQYQSAPSPGSLDLNWLALW